MGQTKRELVEAALQGKPADRVPVGFWHHFLQDQRHADALSDPKAWEDNIQGHESFCRSWDPDFIKVMTDGFFSVSPPGAAWTPLYPGCVPYPSAGAFISVDSKTD